MSRGLTYPTVVSGFSGTVGSSWNSVGVGDSTGGSDVAVAVTVSVTVSVGVSVTVGVGGMSVGVVMAGPVGVVTSSDSSVVVVGVGDGCVGATGSRVGDGGVGGSGVRVVCSGVDGGVVLAAVVPVVPEGVRVVGATVGVVARVGAPVPEVVTWSCAEGEMAGDVSSARVWEGM
ncbi:hypothetical protein [Corynebacterium efficiens YS-314]|uniref:Uncharacterized protein n=1 Tax=Corynebacterium efficiens (strain DSM 44549 / YS-314 / AJ 12310 / JCM 11189 / NBRC 100395) TaxID=196164 RepID=Q8FRJ6_COREF|nr:hypothetical protein [Corynebacterium efficiens YS-314]